MAYDIKATTAEPVYSSSFHIQSKSELKLIGKTNLRYFDCGCKQISPTHSFKIVGGWEDARIIHFAETKINLPITSLDCGKKIMNRDLQKALNAQRYPYITIELLKVMGKNTGELGSSNDWLKMRALTRVHLNGRSNEYWLSVKAKKNEPCTFRFISEKTFHMSDFGVTPPTAMMGLIKVEDKITICLDLQIQVG
jgi:hypothetical protein